MATVLNLPMNETIVGNEISNLIHVRKGVQLSYIFKQSFAHVTKVGKLLQLCEQLKTWLTN